MSDFVSVHCYCFAVFALRRRVSLSSAVIHHLIIVANCYVLVSLTAARLDPDNAIPEALIYVGRSSCKVP